MLMLSFVLCGSLSWHHRSTASLPHVLPRSLFYYHYCAGTWHSPGRFGWTRFELFAVLSLAGLKGLSGMIYQSLRAGKSYLFPIYCLAGNRYELPSVGQNSF